MRVGVGFAAYRCRSRTPGGTGPFDAKAIGEMANNSPPAAIANAVADAVGARVYELPITAERLLDAMPR